MKIQLILLSLGLVLGCQSNSATSPEAAAPNSPKPKVIVLTDINNAGGDPDDKQSLIHLLWYADVLDIRGIIPDGWNRKGYEASLEGLATYRADFATFSMAEKGFTHPDTIFSRIVQTDTAAVDLIIREAKAATDPLYILIWGQMKTFKKALLTAPGIASKIRVLTIGTGRKYGPKDEVPGEDCNVVNWNGPGRNEIYEDPRFDHMWWLESNWTYNGMFVGNRPEEIFIALQEYGEMGKHIKTVVKDHPWAQYFRVGDTPSVLYLIDPDNDLDDPIKGSWAGLFAQPFPDTKPNYYTDDSGTITWDYVEPCNTWDQLEAMYTYNKSTLVDRREGMYAALLEKLNRLYRK